MNSAWIASFYSIQSCLYLNLLIVSGSKSFVISVATVNKNNIVDIYFITILPFPYISIICGLFLIFVFRIPSGVTISLGICVSSRTVKSSGIGDSSNMSAFLAQVLFQTGSWSFIFLFRRALSLELCGLPCFWCVTDNSLVALTFDFSARTTTWADVLVDGIYDLVNFIAFVNATGNWFVIYCKCTILRTSFSH